MREDETIRELESGAVKEHPGPLSECISCDEEMHDVCPKSERSCGHHCNHSWTHDSCCWCGREWGEGEEETNDDQ